MGIMTVNDASVAAVEWLEDIDTIRVRSSYQGALSGQIRRRVEIVKETIRLLAEKLEDTGDPAYLRRRNAELLAELTTTKREFAKMKRDIEDLKRKVQDLTNALTFDIQRVDKATSPMEATQKKKAPRSQSRHKSEVEDSAQTNPTAAEMIMRPPLQGISKPIPAVEKSRLRSLQAHDSNLDAELSRQIVELTSRRRELRQASRGNQNTSRAPSPSRGIPRVIGNVQITPPLSSVEFPPLPPAATVPQRDEEKMEWTAVISKNQRKKQRKAAIQQDEKHPNKGEPKEKARKQPIAKDNPAKVNPPSGKKRRRPPRTAAVAIKGVKEGFSYATALRESREKILLPELGISKTSVRHTANGGVIIEVPGPDRATKAEELRKQVCNTLGEAAVVTRPVIKGDVRLIGLDDSVVPAEIADIVSVEGGCKPDEVKVGAIRPMTNGLFTAWAQCPLGAAIKASQTGKIKVGWTIAKIELLKARPLQCFRCWGHGHLKANCTSPNDRSKNCYRCGEEGHSALACVNPPACVLCKEQGKDSRHRVGSTQCKADFTTVKRGKPGRKAEEMITENA
ncbi:uncharacterized protein LOC114945152 [Nylanderia fulva]|uniref:uncharacterized protein LOC114945152 n=1 Tax=Nylanderia fulva TaxID=613905 RepID=UPI0010FB7D99|nr:uncharacterized protein LOC114945152 [Nylanderia fulva]